MVAATCGPVAFPLPDIAVIMYKTELFYEKWSVFGHNVRKPEGNLQFMEQGGIK